MMIMKLNQITETSRKKNDYDFYDNESSIAKQNNVEFDNNDNSIILLHATSFEGSHNSSEANVYMPSSC